MTGPSPLSIAFIERRPVAAARVLSSIDPGDAAAFLESIPARFVARAFAHMGPWQASSVLIEMSGTGGGAVLKELDYPEAAALLRLLPPDVRPQFLQELPVKLRRDFEISLSFPADTVGAHMSAAALTLRRDHTAADAEDHMRRTQGGGAGIAFVVDLAGRLAGAVGAATLVRHPAQTRLGDIMDESIAPLSGRARLTAVVDLEDWDGYTHLPVVSRQKQVIGVLSHKIARQAMDRDRAPATLRRSSIAASIAEVFLISAFGLTQLLADVDAPMNSSVSGGGRQ